ncbi:uncharacterized protein LOC127638193 [Xyrauchen texanus]|uniref:uncharacterized protein LOC127638193 n=1 Tax=Xyrauchen texanus TaxID=154827 RepID=UPI002241CCE0|nr:uncharacterized protein LOC127638193 [Xyrauchen texanus]
MNIQIYLKINKDTIKTITLATSDEEIGKATVRDVKKKALCHFPGVGTDISRLRLIYNGTDLEDEKTLESYKIENLSVLQAVLKMRGGAQFHLMKGFP